MLAASKIHPSDAGAPHTDTADVPERTCHDTSQPGAARARRAKTGETDGAEKPCEARNASDLARRSHVVSLRDLYDEVAARNKLRRNRFWLKCLWCVVRILWNIASPVKAYMLSFYALSGDDLVFSQNLNWTMEVDYQYAKALYDKSGINYTAPEGQPIRFINMYSDFVVFNRASKWAHHIDDFQQDPYVGQYCRTSLVLDAAGIERDLTPYCLSGFVPDVYVEPTNCRVNEVSEAVMCLKGIDVLTLMNYEWQSAYDPSNPYVQEGARIYQTTVFPDLDACLARRAVLVAKLGRDNALHQLTQELAANYSLDPIGFAGKRGLYAEYRFYQGFTDLSGAPSGMRYSKMSGSLPERTQPIESDLNALVVGRERLWWDVGLPPKTFRDRIATAARVTAPYFYSTHIASNASVGRFIDRYTLTKARRVGACQKWEPVRTSNRTYPSSVYLNGSVESSVLSGFAYKVAGARVIRDNNVTAPSEVAKVIGRMSTQCITRDGCLDACTRPTTAGWIATFDRSGLCQERKVSQSVLHRQGFVDARCLGEGTGSEVFSVKFVEPVVRGDNTSFEYHRITNTADPAAIVACVLGGRIPQAGAEPFPNVFLDLIDRGANTIVTTTFSRGTEKVLVNMYVLVSLLGCTIFSCWVIGNVAAVLRTLLRVKRSGQCDRRTLAQLVDSFFTINFSTASHGRNVQLSRMILWLNLVTWYIGAADINCTWWVDGVDLWTPGFKLKASDSPYYKCKPGVFLAHLGSLLGVVRIVSMAYNFKSITCQHSILRGATRYARSVVSPLMFFGLLPTFGVSVTITAINHLRHSLGILRILHNQFLLILLWVAFLVAYNRLLRHEKIGWLYVELLCRLKVCGKQKVKPGSVAAALVGSYYLTLPEYVRHEETEWIPLSVAMESHKFELDCLDYAARRYSLTGPPPPRSPSTKGTHTLVTTIPSSIPQWVLDDDEYFFC